MENFPQREKIDFRHKLGDVPHKPGVYIMRDRLHRVIYVGKARDLRRRVGQYFMPSRRMTADLKTRALLDSIWDFEWHTVQSEPEALLLEGRLIKEFRPRYNISFRDDKRFLLVKVDPREEWPRFRLTRLRTEDGARYFGPFPNAGALRQTLSFLRKKFGVLTFGRGNPTPRELKSSTYQVPRKLSELTSAQYQDRVNQACALLSGESREILAELEAEMHTAASQLDFEKAAELRNMVENLRQTTKPIHRYTRSYGHRLGAGIDPAADIAELAEELRLPRPVRRMECFDISNISSTHIVASMVCFIDGKPANSLYRRYRITGVKGQDDFASMAEVVRRRYRRVLAEGQNGYEKHDALAVLREDSPSLAPEHIDLSPEFSQEAPADALGRVRPASIPDLIIVDGGRGQLGAACHELQRLGLWDLPIIGLAKEFEEIHRPGSPNPLRLSHESGALRLLQRIRDEAHRFANGYHQLLMKRRISESILDDCPGVSPNRKQLLLKRFGSVARLRAATLEEIAALPGIGPSLADRIQQFLAERKNTPDPPRSAKK
jgi:excinuclease ABC subunit C